MTMSFRSSWSTSRIDQFATGNADLLILIGRILLAWGVCWQRVWSTWQLQWLSGLFSVAQPSSAAAVHDDHRHPGNTDIGWFDTRRWYALLRNFDVSICIVGYCNRTSLLGISRRSATVRAVQQFPEEHLDLRRRSVDPGHRRGPVLPRSEAGRLAALFVSAASSA
ncbi:hypothetical protein [Bradyrhizobium ottawaense]|uniref:hypothetical protein n=1 Tax=Bradyrhizobium ottawaense TaxID=931866 RepID=UPI003F49132E